MRLEHIKILGKSPHLLRAIIIIMIIGLIVGIVFNKKPLQKNEETHNSSGYYDGFDVM